jgi:hypothetical protein
MNSGGNALAIVCVEALVTAGYVKDGRIELLVEGFGKGFAEPLQAWGWGSILKGNHDHGAADCGVAVQSLSGGGSVLGAKRRAQKQRDQKDDNSSAFHDKLIISASAAAA